MRKMPRQARSRATTDALLDAASRILAAKGWDSLTTNEVAIVAGVSIGSLYQYFPNKLALAHALHERHGQQLIAAVAAAARTGRRGAPISRLVDTLIALHVRDPRSYRVLLEDVPRGDDAAFVRDYAIAWKALIVAQVPGARSIDTAALVLSHAVAAAIHAAADDGVLGQPAVHSELHDLVEGYLSRLRRRRAI
jgi:AcrR family transcriptional regulator